MKLEGWISTARGVAAHLYEERRDENEVVVLKLRDLAAAKTDEEVGQLVYQAIGRRAMFRSMEAAGDLRPEDAEPYLATFVGGCMNGRSVLMGAVPASLGFSAGLTAFDAPRETYRLVDHGQGPSQTYGPDGRRLLTALYRVEP